MAKMSVDELRDVASVSSTSDVGTGVSIGALGAVFGGVFVAVLAGGLGWSAMKDKIAVTEGAEAPNVVAVVADPSASFEVTGGQCFREASGAMRKKLKKNVGMQMRMMVGDVHGGFGSQVEIEADTIACTARATGSFCDSKFRRAFALYVKDFQRGLSRNNSMQASVTMAVDADARREWKKVRSRFSADAVGRVQGTVASLMDRGLLRPDDFGGFLVPVPDWATALAPDTLPQRAC